jgi:glycolate oxidase
MTMTKKTFTSLDEVRGHILKGTATIYHGSKTSTVVAYDQLAQYAQQNDWGDWCMGDLSQLPKKCHLDEHNQLHVEGPVTWSEAKAFCRSKGRDIMTAPTEELACVLAGVSTSCTGERCFGFGTLRDQVVELGFINFKGEDEVLSAERDLVESSRMSSYQEELLNYQNTFAGYASFKNGPFPRFEKETDLLIGTEGQLGVVTKGVFKTTPLESVHYLFVALPKWEEDFTAHLELFEAVQEFRQDVLSCELLDENSWRYLDPEDRPREGKDIVYLEVRESELENIYDNLLSQLKYIGPDDFFAVSENKAISLRMAIPRRVFERNSQEGVVKKGTDIQVSGERLKELLLKYRELSQKGIRYNLFGHFGDAHLHFNFMPTQAQVSQCQDLLEDLYHWVKKVGGSPFAEHGIGLLKQDFIKPFYTCAQEKLFAILKKEMDPSLVFFPFGFLRGQRDGE